jgi:hypothetical protein
VAMTELAQVDKALKEAVAKKLDSDPKSDRWYAAMRRIDRLLDIRNSIKSGLNAGHPEMADQN